MLERHGESYTEAWKLLWVSQKYVTTVIFVRPHMGIS